MKHRNLPSDELAQISSVAEACDVLRSWGEPDLADRIAYFASNADLDDGDVPVTLESALGFLAFFGAVESEGQADLGCSSEGWICAEWFFSDNRLVSVLFPDRDKVDCAARKSDGRFIEINSGGDTGNRSFIMAKLVESGEWFTWFKGSPAAVNSDIRTT